MPWIVSGINILGTIYFRMSGEIPLTVVTVPIGQAVIYRPQAMVLMVVSLKSVLVLML